jgi:hypothetical protein
MNDVDKEELRRLKSELFTTHQGWVNTYTEMIEELEAKA